MIGNLNELTLNNLKFAIESYKSLKNVEKSHLDNGVPIIENNLVIAFPKDSKATPQFEFRKKGKTWVLFEHGKLTSVFDEKLLDKLSKILYNKTTGEFLWK